MLARMSRLQSDLNKMFWPRSLEMRTVNTALVAYQVGDVEAAASQLESLAADLNGTVFVAEYEECLSIAKALKGGK